MSKDAPGSHAFRGSMPRRFAVGALLGLVAAAIVLAQTSFGRSVLRRAHVEQSPTAFAQLYFTDPNRLPVDAAARTVHERVAFVIVNDEHRARRFAWAIETRGSATSTAGRLTLGVGASRAISRTVTIRCDAPRVYETVALASPRETIGYWQTCPRAAHAAPRTRRGSRADRHG